MNVDRALFLSLSAAMAASACNPGPSRPWRGSTMTPPGTPPAPGTPPPGTPPPWSGGSAAGAPPPPGAMPAPTHEGGMPAPTHEGGGASTGSWREECRRLTPPGPTCEGLQGGLDLCVGAIENTQPSHHDALKSCIRGLGAQALCNNRIYDQCLVPHLTRAGAGRAPSAACRTATSRCGGRYSPQLCEGLRATARDGFDFYHCDETCGARCLDPTTPPPPDRPAPRSNGATIDPFG